ncbi:hypothetical protein [Actinoplanes sp. NPDC051411]|uniref:hypothetical protein n=1 Tax=Actinoplanes sp. NPDC051411 TaxID=3155522 RepID=UPI003431282F
MTTTDIRAHRRVLSGGNAGTIYTTRQKRSSSDTIRPLTPERAVDRLRELAAAGRLSDAAAEGRPDRTALVGAAYTLVWPIVYSQVTRRFERQRGHHGCAAGVANLLDECLDRFHDDVEGVVDDLLTHAHKPILNVEAWVSSRVGAATVNAYRRRRGSRGALQRPRLPGWLAGELGHDRWLGALAVNILVWVGVAGTAGCELWPLDAWAQERGATTGDWWGSDPAAVERDIVRVLAAMRTRPEWYESFVERPLGAKQTPVVAAATDVYGEPVAPLDLGDPDRRIDGELHRLAHNAVLVIGDRIRRGEAAEEVVAEVIRTVFGGSVTSAFDQVPHRDADPLGGVTGALVDRDRLARITSTALSILGERDT